MTDASVADVMTSPVLTLEESTAVTDAADAMIDQRINSVVIIDEACQPQGIFTSTDALRIVADSANGAIVAEYMTEDVLTVGSEVPLTAVAEMMAEDDIGHLPVTGPDGQVSGMLSQTDLAAHLSDENTDQSAPHAN